MTVNYSSPAEAAQYLMDSGYADKGNGHYVKRAMTQGNLSEAPYMRAHIATVVHHRVDPVWDAPDYYSVRWL